MKVISAESVGNLVRYGKSVGFSVTKNRIAWSARMEKDSDVEVASLHLADEPEPEKHAIPETSAAIAVSTSIRNGSSAAIVQTKMIRVSTGRTHVARKPRFDTCVTVMDVRIRMQPATNVKVDASSAHSVDHWLSSGFSAQVSESHVPNPMKSSKIGTVVRASQLENPPLHPRPAL